MSQFFDYTGVVEEVLPEGAEDHLLNGVKYDESKFLVEVSLSLDEGQLKTETVYRPYNESGNSEGG